MVEPPSRTVSLLIELIGSAAVCALAVAADVMLERARRIRRRS
ncbi:MAG: hypothetical protein ACP5P1_14095 [Acidimicrobiales bacterium]